MQTNFGSGLFFATPLYDASGNAVANPTPIKLGILQDVSLDIQMDVKELKGSKRFAVDVASGNGKISGKATAAQILARAYDTLIFAQGIATGSTKIYSDTTGAAIPGTPYSITPTMPGSGTWAADLGVTDAFGIPYVRVASSPSTGQYSVSAGVYTFAAADTTKVVYISCRYTVTTGSRLIINNLEMGDVALVLGEMFLTRRGKSFYVQIPQMICPKLAFAAKADDFMVPNFDFSAFADASGKVLEISTTE